MTIFSKKGKGLYIHVPFCSQACRYCDFYFTVSVRYMDDFVDRLLEEIRIRADSETGGTFETLYLGGGTPSLLKPGQLDRILSQVHRKFTFRDTPEVTIECNPDNLDRNYLQELRKRGFNRLSIGIQSFQQNELRLLRRSHTADQAEDSVRKAADAGFDNITIDLIYGIPDQGMDAWESNLKQALSLPVSHLSAYHLTYEPGTVFDHWRKQGKLVPVHEELSLKQFRLLRNITASAGFDHYEISNFSKQGRWSQHNLIYWTGGSYVGLGPSAHSYDGTIRSWNNPSLKGYMEAIRLQLPFSEQERLTQREKYHDYLITSLRTRHGIDMEFMERNFGSSLLNHFQKKSKPFLTAGSLILTDSGIAIDPDQWMITDMILRDLFIEEDDER
jgi:oxygen-independent coproporphyrinogen-3 oxidase